MRLNNVDVFLVKTLNEWFMEISQIQIAIYIPRWKKYLLFKYFISRHKKFKFWIRNLKKKKKRFELKKNFYQNSKIFYMCIISDVEK